LLIEPIVARSDSSAGLLSLAVAAMLLAIFHGVRARARVGAVPSVGAG
jgi:hypothetical protein